jgi:hypothetical protein
MLPQTLADLADLLGTDPSSLTSLAATANCRYRQHSIPKANGGVRQLAEPDCDLKAVQRRLLDRVLDEVPLHPAATAFHAGASVQANAATHTGRAFVFSTDLVDFFPTVTQPRVEGLLAALGAPADVARLIGKLACCRGRLAQGAPTSPAIANLLARKLDLRMSGFCARRGWCYTRYADDMTVSGNGHFGERDRRWIVRCVEAEGFVVNECKTRLTRHHQAQVVTGLSVNGECRLPREQRQRLRAIFHQAALAPADFAARLDELRGHVAWLRAVEPSNQDVARYRAVLLQVMAADLHDYHAPSV